MISRYSRSVQSLRVSNPLPRITSSHRYRNFITFINRKPFSSFFAALGVLLLILILGSVITNLNKKEEKKTTPIKSVRTYTIGRAPTVALQAKIEKNGVVQIVAQAPGIVQTIHVKDGDNVSQGQSIVSLSTNYQGGSAPALQAALAGASAKNANDTYNLQKNIIKDQRDIATASAENTEQLRQISEKSLGDTRGLLSMNEDLLKTVNDQITAIEQIDPSSRTPDQIASLATYKGTQAQLQSGVDQLRSAVRSVEYQTDTNNPPTLLATKQKELTLKQLDVQEKALDLNKRVSQLQYSLALVQEGMMHPAAPFAGQVQRVNVDVGQNVNPGDVIATISSNNVSTTAVINAPAQIANSVSRVEASIFHIKDQKISLTPSYVSTVATTGQLYSITYCFPDGVGPSLTDGEFVTVDVPVGVAQTNGIDPFVPIDSVYESQNESTVYLIENKKAVARKITVDEVYGSFVSVTSGLHDGDQIILDRNVVAGDSVKTEK